MVFKKCREVDDVLSIDASTCFEKGKNENRLRDEDVDRIIAAYRDRTEEARFSHRATLAEIAGNDYNLNILRYVDTFEAGARIDLTEVSRGGSRCRRAPDRHHAGRAVYCHRSL